MRGCCRWGTTDKIRIVDKYCESEPTKVYVGIAIDEPKRIEKERKPYKIFPLVEWGMTEKECLEYCRNNGWDWKEETPNGYIDLYDILDRVSCWCCSNKNRKELKNIYLYFQRFLVVKQEQGLFLCLYRLKCRLVLRCLMGLTLLILIFHFLYQ